MELPRALRTVCAHDCPDACSVVVTVEDGRSVRFGGDPDHPITRGFLCGKVNAYADVASAGCPARAAACAASPR